MTTFPRWALTALAALALSGPGCFTARVLVAPGTPFKPGRNGVDTVLALSYLTLGVGGGAAAGHNAPADDSGTRRVNAIRGGVLGVSVGFPLIVLSAL